MYIKRLGTWEGKLLRIYGPVVEQGIWRMRTDQKLRELYKELGIVADNKQKRLERIVGLHVVRMDQGRTVKKIFESKPGVSIRKEKPRLGWLDDVGRSTGDKG
jgi:hypothetical protein